MLLKLDIAISLEGIVEVNYTEHCTATFYIGLRNNILDLRPDKGRCFCPQACPQAARSSEDLPSGFCALVKINYFFCCFAPLRVGAARLEQNSRKNN